MNIVDKLYTEWAWRTKSGVPDINNPEDKAILGKILKEFKILDENEEDSTAPKANELTDREVSELVSAFKKIQTPYSRYLSVFNYFDNNSLGTISEVLLVKLLNRVGIDSTHTGASGGLTDLTINGKDISLKTTTGATKIGLGSDEATSTSTHAKQVKDVLNKIYEENPDFTEYTVEQMKDYVEPEIYNLLLNRLKAISTKLSGAENKEFFVWVEKVHDSKSGILKQVIFHTVKYDRDKVYNEFLKHKLYSTKTGWGVKNPSDDSVAIYADTSGKLLNIAPAFVRKSTKENNIPITLIDPEVVLDKKQISNTITDKLLNSLDKIYSDVFEKD